MNINLINGDFTISEARDLLISLINEKINFHKLQRLRDSEGDENADDKFSKNRIAELERVKTAIKVKFAEKDSKTNVNCSGVISIKFS